MTSDAMTSSKVASAKGSGPARSTRCRSASAPSRVRATSSIPALASMPVTLAPRGEEGPRTTTGVEDPSAGDVSGEGQGRGPFVVRVGQAGLVLEGVRLGEGVVVVAPGVSVHPTILADGHPPAPEPSTVRSCTHTVVQRTV